MAVKTYAKINVDNVVLEICSTETALSKDWILVPSNTTNRWDYAGVGDTYSPDDGRFTPPQPYPSWILDKATYKWEAPIAYPADGKMYKWNEDTASWEKLKVGS